MADAIWKELDVGTELIRSCPPGNSEKKKAAWNAFRKAALHATSSKDPPPEVFLDDVIEKGPIIQFLSDFHGEKRMYQKQVEAVFEKLLEVDSWLWVLIQDAALAGGLADKLKDIFLKVKDSRPLSEPPAPAAPPVASTAFPPMASAAARGSYRDGMQALLDAARKEQEAEEAEEAAAEAAAAAAEAPAASSPAAAEAPSTIEAVPADAVDRSLPAAEAPAVVAAAAYSLPAGIASPTTPFSGVPGKYDVTVLGAMDLPNTDGIGGKSDPYCKVSMGGTMLFSTPTVNNNLNPSWGTKRAIEWDGMNDIMFTIMDKDLFTKDDFMAQYVLPKENVPQGISGDFALTVNPQFVTPGMKEPQITLMVRSADPSAVHLPVPAAGSGASGRVASPVPSKGYPSGANASIRMTPKSSGVDVSSIRARFESGKDGNQGKEDKQIFDEAPKSSVSDLRKMWSSKGKDEVKDDSNARRAQEEQERQAQEAAEEERKRQAEAERLAREEEERRVRAAAEAEEQKRRAEEERIAREEEERRAREEEQRRAREAEEEEKRKRMEERQAKIKAEEERKAREFEEWCRAEEERKAREAAELAAIKVEPATADDFWKKSSIWGPAKSEEAAPAAMEPPPPPSGPAPPPPPSATAVRRVVAEAWAAHSGGSPAADAGDAGSSESSAAPAAAPAPGRVLFPGEKDFARYVSNFQSAVNMMEELNFSAERRDPSSDAFNKFYKAVLKTTSSDSKEDDAELEKLEPKAQIIAFLVDIKTRRSAMTGRVSAVFKRLDEFESWQSASTAHRDPVITRTVRDLVTMDTDPGRASGMSMASEPEITRSPAVRDIPASVPRAAEPPKRSKPKKSWVVWYSIDPRRGEQQFYKQEVIRMMESAWRRGQSSVDISPLMPCKMRVDLKPRLSQVTDKGSRDVIREELESAQDIVISYVKKNHHNAWKATRSIGEKAYFYSEATRRWVECTITGVDATGGVIAFDASGEETTVPQEKLGTHFKEARDLTFAVGQRVMYLSDSRGKWYDGVVVKPDADGSPGVTVNVGGAEKPVPMDKMRSHLKASSDSDSIELRSAAVPAKTAIPLER